MAQEYVTISDLPPVSASSNTDEVEVNQAGTHRRTNMGQMRDFLLGGLGGYATIDYVNETFAPLISPDFTPDITIYAPNNPLVRLRGVGNAVDEKVWRLGVTTTGQLGAFRMNDADTAAITQWFFEKDGKLTIPAVALGDNGNNAATTAFVKGQLGSYLPLAGNKTVTGPVTFDGAGGAAFITANDGIGMPDEISPGVRTPTRVPLLDTSAFGQEMIYAGWVRSLFNTRGQGDAVYKYAGNTVVLTNDPGDGNFRIQNAVTPPVFGTECTFSIATTDADGIARYLMLFQPGDSLIVTNEFTPTTAYSRYDLIEYPVAHPALPAVTEWVTFKAHFISASGTVAPPVDTRLKITGFLNLATGDGPILGIVTETIPPELPGGLLGGGNVGVLTLTVDRTIVAMQTDLATYLPKANPAFTGTMTGPTFNATNGVSAYNIDGALVLTRGSYTGLYDTKGIATIVMGNVGDPSNYYRQNTHRFQHSDGSTDYFGIAASGANFAVPLTALTPAVGSNDTNVATTAFVKAQGYLTTAAAGTTYLPLAGGTLTGNLGIGGAPTVPLDVQGNLVGNIVMRLHNAQNSGGTQFIQSISDRSVTRTLAYSSQHLQEANTGILIRYSDFDTHYFRSGTGVVQARMEANVLYCYSPDSSNTLKAYADNTNAYVFPTKAASNLYLGAANGTIAGVTPTGIHPTSDGVSTLGVAAGAKWSGVYAYTAAFINTITAATPAVGNNSTQVATTAFVRSNALSLYSEHISTAGQSGLIVTIPSGAKRIELEYYCRPNTIADLNLDLYCLVGGSPVTTAVYAVQMLLGQGVTPSAAYAAGQTEMRLGSGAYFKAVLRAWLVPSGNYALEGTGYAQSTAGVRTAIVYAIDGAVPSNTISGFRLQFSTGATFAVGSTLRCSVMM